jgi:transcriptional regulator with XRE-family HTH domain
MTKASKAKPKTRSPTSVDTQIGLRIRHIRMQQKLSQEELGEALGVSFQQVQKYEKGSNRLSLSRAMQVAKALNTTVNEVAGIDGNGAVTTVGFDYQVYDLSRALSRLTGRPKLAAHFRNVIDSVCDNLEENGKRKR